MKVNKFNEEIKTVNLSDMEDWSVKNNIAREEMLKAADRLHDLSGKMIPSTKKLDLELGYKVIELLNKNGLGIVSIPIMGWLNKHGLILPDETKFQEYRVSIGKKMDWDDFLSDYEIDNKIDYNDLSEDEQEKINDIYDELPYEADRHRIEIEFSFFLPPKTQYIEASAMSDASTYLKLLIDSGFELYSRAFDEYDVFYHEPISTTKFINGKNIIVTNKNLEIINTISYRLYKDGKAFDGFKEYLGSEYNAKKFFNEWLKLIK